MFSRRKALRVLLATAPIAACVDAFAIEPSQLSVTHKTIFIKDLPPGLEGFRIAQLSDFHYKPDKDAELMEAAVHRVNQEQVDLVALTGDFITDDSSVLMPLLQHLKKLKSTHGSFAVMGNHDGWVEPGSFFKKHCETAGIHFLINQNTSISHKGTPLHIAGTDFIWHGAPDPSLTLQGIPHDETLIALVHEPDYFDTMRRMRRIHLQLSGHTHGGQCRVPLIGYAPVKVRYGEKYIYGHYQKGPSQLFVSRGTGTSGIRVRFSCPPELAILTLQNAKS